MKTSRSLSPRVLGVIFALIACVAAIRASAESGPTPQIVQPVDEGARIALSGNVHPLAQARFDRGAVAAELPAGRMLVVLRRSPAREAQLQAFLASLQDHNSPNFHHWLTPEQFGSQWGAADSDIAAITRWLRSHGFTVAGATRGKNAIEFSGTIGQVAETFHTPIHSFLVNDETHHANVRDPEIPAALAPAIAGISTLNDFHPRSLAKPGPRGVYNAKAGRVQPNLTIPTAYGDYLYLGPADVATIYDTPNALFNPAFKGTSITGAGATIGIAGDSNIDLTQNVHYRQIFEVLSPPPTVVIDGQNPGVNGDAIEAYLDTQVAGGVAPGANVILYTAAGSLVDYGLNLAIFRAINDNQVDVLNVSFGLCEGFLGASGNATYLNAFEQAAAQGISVTVSTGDSGSAGCDDSNTQSVAYFGLQVSGIASTPYDIAVGGTDFAALAGPDGYGADFGNYVSATSDPKTKRSALGYIPEVPWNNSFSNYPPGPYATNVAWGDPYSNIAGGGGGRSACVNSDLTGNGNLYCHGGYPKPSWQAGPGVSADKTRDIPDVSLFASNGFFFAIWGLCTDSDTDSNGNPVTDCVPGSNGLPSGDFYISSVGGTSASAPAFAGMLALLRQSTGERQGQATPSLYKLAASLPAAFHDTQTGNNAVPCDPTVSPNCQTNAAGSTYVTGYDARAGYDLATGLGSVDAAALIAGWSSAGLSATTTQLTATPTSIQHGQPVTVDATVTSSGGTPTGSVALVADTTTPHGSSDAVVLALNSAGTTGTQAVKSLPGGSYSLLAKYPGDAEFAPSISSSIALTVTPEPSTVLLNAYAYNPVTGQVFAPGALQYGYPVAFLAQPYGNNSTVTNGVVQPDGIPTGTVTLTEGSANYLARHITSEGFAEWDLPVLTTGTHQWTASYSGDPSFDASTGSSTFTVTPAPTKLQMYAFPTTYNGSPFQFAINMTTSSFGAAPNGKVILESAGKVFASGLLNASAGDISSGTYAAGSVTITTTNVPPGPNSVVAKFVGDGLYGASVSNVVDINGRPGFTIQNITTTIASPTGTAAPFFQVTSLGGYTGTVNLTCALLNAPKAPKPPECAFYPTASLSVPANQSVQGQILIFGIGTKLPGGVTLGQSNGMPSLAKGAGVLALAALLLFGIPARRRAWRNLLGIVLLLAAIAGVTACSRPKHAITAGRYVFQMTGVDSKDSTNNATGTVTVNVN